MKHAMKLIGGLILILMLAACQAPNHTSPGTQMKLKTYSVPTQNSAQVAATLRTALRAVDPHATVSQPTPGTLLVYASRNTQTSVENLTKGITDILGKGPQYTPLHVHFWVVNAMTGAGTNDPVLKPLKQTLAQVASQWGPSHFLLSGAASAVAMLGQHSAIDTGSNHFGFTAQLSSDGSITMQVHYRAQPTAKSKLATAFGQASGGISQLEATVATKPGQYVVLAQAPIHTMAKHDDHDKTASQPIMRLLVMRVDQARPASH